jgi:sodium/bile acid cotransporter 7
MKLRLPSGVDPFLVFLILTVIAATVLPCRGDGAHFFDLVTKVAITLLFFLHGAKLSREAILAGIGHWRLHLLVAAVTFVAFPAMGLVAFWAAKPFLGATLASGLMFLCLLPSTVQSSIAFTSIARGNVPAAVCSATLSNLVGVVVTPLLVGLLLGAVSRGGGVSLDAFLSIGLQLLLPFVLGHLSRPLTAGWIGRHKSLVNITDRGSILLVVYTAFSAAVVDGLWTHLSAAALLGVLVINAMILGAAVMITTLVSKRLGFSREDQIAIVFCGSKKSLASGVPMAGVLFPAAVVGPVIVPLMLFHQMQLMLCAVLARRYAAEARS